MSLTEHVTFNTGRKHPLARVLSAVRIAHGDYYDQVAAENGMSAKGKTDLMVLVAVSAVDNVRGVNFVHDLDINDYIIAVHLNELPRGWRRVVHHTPGTLPNYTEYKYECAEFIGTVDPDDNENIWFDDWCKAVGSGVSEQASHIMAAHKQIQLRTR